jgi:hypothetical protein
MSTSDSKFAEFLTKIYNNKYKLPRVENAFDGKGFKQAVTADILYSSILGCCQGFSLGVGLKYLFENVHFKFYEYSYGSHRVVPQGCSRSFGIKVK